jgi:hypothetical protein
MRMSHGLVIAMLLFIPLQVAAQTGGGSGGVGAGGSGDVTTGIAPSRNSPGTANTPGTNSLGTAQSSGRGTVGSAGGSRAEDKQDQDENRRINQKLRSICKGC